MAQQAIMTEAERLRREGHQAGRREGRREERRVVLRELLEMRFGPLPAAALTRIHRADAEALDRWVPRVLTAQRLDEVFADEP